MHFPGYFILEKTQPETKQKPWAYNAPSLKPAVIYNTVHGFCFKVC